MLVMKTYLPSVVHESWHNEPCFSEKIMNEIKQKLGQTDLSKLCPAKLSQVFNMFKMPLNDIDVVIVGQDPYNNQLYANGIAFSITSTSNGIPFSLQVLAKSIHDDCAVPGVLAKDYFDFTLVSLLEQDVFFLNTALTCEVGEKNAHQYIWIEFMTILFRGTFSALNNVVFYFLGNEAEKYSQYVKHFVVSSHPAASAHGTPFVGKWNEINEMLVSKCNKSPITWTIPF